MILEKTFLPTLSVMGGSAGLRLGVGIADVVIVAAEAAVAIVVPVARLGRVAVLTVHVFFLQVPPMNWP
jgi:hypothetical protein